MDLRRALGEGGAHVDDGGERVDLELDRLGGVAGLGQRLGDDGGDGVADVADLVLGEDRVLRLLHHLAEAVGDLPAAGDAADSGEVGGGEDLEHARHRLGGGGVELHDPAVRHVGAQEADIGLVGAVEIGGVAALAGEEADVLAAQDRCADAVILGHVRSLPYSAATRPGLSSSAAAWMDFTMLW